MLKSYYRQNDPNEINVQPFSYGSHVLGIASL